MLRTKHAVASLANRVPRDEIARLLADAEAEVREQRSNGRSRHPMLATAVLSLAGLWLATTSLDGPRDWRRSGLPVGYEPVVGTMTPVSMTPVLVSTVPPVTSMPVTMATMPASVTILALTADGRIVRAARRRVSLTAESVRSSLFPTNFGRLAERSAVDRNSGSDGTADLRMEGMPADIAMPLYRTASPRSGNASGRDGISPVAYGIPGMMPSERSTVDVMWR
ncbi:MAG: hypothetical protein SFU56_10520 [Capsulimonadales bacterium]|nr:hypothetical protein [Capsulimonadales bacterium]